MRNKLVLIIAVAVLMTVILACQSNTQSATNVNSNTVEKPQTETADVVEEQPQPETATAIEPEAVVLEFYKLYLKNFIANKKLPPATMKRYLTERMLKEIKDTTDADVVIQAQDYDETWANNVNIKGKEKISNTKVIVTVELKGESFSQELEVTTLAQNKTWKIDSAKDTDAVESDTDSADTSNIKTTVVKFPRGKTGADYQDTISPGETHIYVVNVRQGQYFGGQTYSDDYGVPFTVRRKDGEELEVPAESVKWGGDAPESGDYEIVVSGVKKKTKYTISIGAQ